MTMLYSRWRPDVGSYDVFESPERRGLGDDMPMPVLPRGTAIGVASTDIGRTPPGGLRHVGVSRTAKGAIMQVSRSGLSGTFDVMSMLPGWVTASVLGVVGLAIWWDYRKGDK